MSAAWQHGRYIPLRRICLSQNLVRDDVDGGAGERPAERGCDSGRHRANGCFPIEVHRYASGAARALVVRACNSASPMVPPFTHLRLQGYQWDNARAGRRQGRHPR